ATLNSLQQSLTGCKPRSDIEKVVVHVGGNDLDSLDTDTSDDLTTPLSQLLSELRRVFPSAHIGFTTILPRKRISLARTSNANTLLD
ncbi:hypothetical protein BaRGS_00037466, partial [Batillaria attramentaria]